MPHNAQLGDQSGKGIIANFRARIGDLVDEGRFASIGQAQQANICEKFQPQPDPHFLPRLAGLVLARGAVGRALITGIAATAQSAFQEDFALSDFGEVSQYLFAIFGEYLRTYWHLDHKIWRACARAILAHALPAPLGLEMLGIAEINQRIERMHRFEHDIAAPAAITTIGTTIFNIFLTPETDGPRAASAGLKIYLGLIEEMHGHPLCISPPICEHFTYLAS